MTTSPLPQPLDRGAMRVSDADRDLVVNVLNSAFAEGRITHEELDERMNQVLTSRTFNDLRPLTADLMPAPMTEQYVTRAPFAGTGASVVVDPRGAAQFPDTISAVMANRKRLTGWRMAPRTVVNAVMGDVTLDLRDGVMQAHTCELNLNCIMGDVKLYVPDGVIVLDRSTTVLGDSSIKGIRPASVGAPTIVVTGYVILSDLKVMGPDHVSWAKKLGLTSS